MELIGKVATCADLNELQQALALITVAPSKKRKR
jgi:hypothetical protein